jgi:hypothetical protein
MAARLYRSACGILIGLGGLHAVGAVIDAFAPTFFAPRDGATLAAIRATPVELGRLLAGEHMTVWRGHLGWNLSHGLAVAFTGGLLLRLRATAGRARLGALLSLAWTVLAATCWFWVPCAAFALAALGFAGAARHLPASPPSTPGSRSLVLGTLPIGIAGTLHLLATVPDVFGPALFSPSDPAVRTLMEHADIALPAMLGARASFWWAYVGFNLSHGLGAGTFTLFAWLCARDPAAREDRVVRWMFAAAACLWCAAAIAFWFYAVVVFTALASVLLIRNAMTTAAPR